MTVNGRWPKCQWLRTWLHFPLWELGLDLLNAGRPSVLKQTNKQTNKHTKKYLKQATTACTPRDCWLLFGDSTMWNLLNKVESTQHKGNTLTNYEGERGGSMFIYLLLFLRLEISSSSVSRVLVALLLVWGGDWDRDRKRKGLSADFKALSLSKALSL